MSLISKIIEDVKQKKELQNLDDEIIKKEIQIFLTKNPKLKNFLEKHEIRNINRSSKYKETIKQVRANLRKYYGAFVKTSSEILSNELSKLKVIIESTNNIENLKEISKKIMELHQSTKERNLMYPFIYSKLWKITQKPNSILDLGAGLNPLSYPFMNLEKLNYIAVELNAKDCEILNEYFKAMAKFDLKGKALNIDLNTEEGIKQISQIKIDVCFIFKLLDLLKKGYKKEILKAVKSKYIIVSFPTETLSGKKMTFKRRIWFEKICENLNYPFEILEIDNEIFYIVKK